jgi:hypothetical protein
MGAAERNVEGVRVKPCELPCEKCGHEDVHRKFRTEGERWRPEDSRLFRSAYAYKDCYTAIASRDHIEHACRCCGYGWQTLPMRAPATPEPTDD